MRATCGDDVKIPTFQTLAFPLALCLATLLVFAPLCSNQFEFINLDDDLYVTANPHVQKGVTLESLWWNFANDYSNHWHPLTWLSLQIDYELYGLNPWGYHLTNVLLHTASALMVFLFLRSTTGAVWLSALAAIFFAVHPLRVEAVAWIADRKGVLSTFFWMLTLLAYVSYAKRPSWQRYLAVSAAYLAGLMSKPTLVTLPCVLLLLDYWPLRRFQGDQPNYQAASVRRLLLEKTPLLIVALAFSRLFVQSQGELVWSFERLPLLPRLQNALVSYGNYLGMTFWPMDLGLHYPHPMNTLTAWQVGGAALLLLAVSAYAVCQYRKQPYFLVGWLWFLGTLVPVIGLVQLTDLAMADRWVYVPSIGLLIAAVWTIADFARRWRVEHIAAIVAVVLLAACFALTWFQIQFWRNSVTVWERSLDVTTHNPMAHKFLGYGYIARGDAEQGERHLLAALELYPNDPSAALTLGRLLLRQQRWTEAERWLGAANRMVDLGISDSRPRIRGQSLAGLATILNHREEFEKAERYLREALRWLPADAETHFQLGLALTGQERFAEARSILERTVELDPRHTEAREKLESVRAKHNTKTP